MHFRVQWQVERTDFLCDPLQCQRHLHGADANDLDVVDNPVKLSCLPYLQGCRKELVFCPEFQGMERLFCRMVGGFESEEGGRKFAIGMKPESLHMRCEISPISKSL